MQVAVLQVVGALPVGVAESDAGFGEGFVSLGEAFVDFFLLPQLVDRGGDVCAEVEVDDVADAGVECGGDDAGVAVADVLGDFGAGGGAGAVAVFFGGLVLAEHGDVDFAAAVLK